MALPWTPVNTRTEANKAAHRSARAFFTRVGLSFGSTLGTPFFRDVLVSYRDIAEHSRLLRRIYSPPHPSSPNKPLDTGDYFKTTQPPAELFHCINLILNPSPLCPQCLAPDTIIPSASVPTSHFTLFPPTYWEQAMDSSDAQVQLALTNRAAQVAENIASSAVSLPGFK